MRERNFVGILFGQARLSGQMGEVLLAMAGGRCCRARWISQAALAPAGGCSAPWAPASRSQSSRADSLSKQCRDKQTQAQSPVSNFKGRAEKLKQARPAARALTAKEAKPQVQKPPTARAESRGAGSRLGAGSGAHSCSSTTGSTATATGTGKNPPLEAGLASPASCICSTNYILLHGCT